MEFSYFTYSEFRCPCCNENHMNDFVIHALDDARGYAGIPFRINSGYRCEAHNEAVGGSLNSSHMKGWAVDIDAQTSNQKYHIIKALLGAGFKRIGVHRTFIHADMDPDKYDEVIWTY